MNTILPLEERSISQIYLETQENITYTIPIYQRNYAWEEDEIASLIKDVYDSYLKDSTRHYYIGTLVTYKRGDNEYEVIDGQQRLTTIYIILKALGVKDIKNKLTYSARKASASTIDKLDNYPNLGDEVDSGIRNGYKFAKSALENIVGIDSPNTCDDFIEYFTHKVHIIHYRVPKDVDLNHYFEVMNSRGEQLEKHEIVKSILSQYLKDRKDLSTFGRVWEACSEMNLYIQQAYPEKDVFSKHLDSFFIDNFKEIPQQAESEGKETIIDLLTQSTEKIDEENTQEQSDKFQPIIDFPNFLLIVLKLTRITDSPKFNPTDFTLDDKELLNEFYNALNEFTSDSKKENFVQRFALNMLRAKYFLDNYIVHHTIGEKEVSGDNPWKLQYYYQEFRNRKVYRYPKNLSDKSDVQKELVHLLSMFEVSFTPKQRKNYLFYCLLFLFENSECTEKEYLDFLQSLAHKYFYDVYLNEDCLNDRNQPVPNAFDLAILEAGKLQVDEIGNEDSDYREVFKNIYQQGKSDIPLFVFNYADYILWQEYSYSLRGNQTKKGSKGRNLFFQKLGCSDFGLDFFDNFYFSRTRKSLEHFYPQAKAVKDQDKNDNNISKSEINCFGNFAMIGAEANSSGSNWNPETKLKHYLDAKSDPMSVASLKFRIMMQICQDNAKAMLNGNIERREGFEWNIEDIEKHQDKMLDIIFSED